MKKIEEILIQCIDDIKAGRASLDDCLNRYPDLRNKLEPLMKVALSIKETSDAHPSAVFKARVRANLMEYIHTSQTGKQTIKSPSQAGFKQVWYYGWARAIAITVAVILVISTAGTGTAFASQSSLPGDTLYFVKISTEQLQRIITFDVTSEVELELKFAGIRLDELEELTAMSAEQTAMITNSNEKILTMSIINFSLNEPEINATILDRIAQAVAGYEKNLNLAITKAEKVMDGETSLEMVALAILGHLVRLDEIEESASGRFREAIINTREIMINGHIIAVHNLSRINPVRATEINLQAIQDRLNKAETEASRGNAKGVEDALQDYERLRRYGEEISDSAGMRGQDTIPVDEMNALATTGQLETLGSIYGKVSQETKGTVEQSMGVAVEAYGQAVQGLQQQGAQGDIPTEPSLPDDIPDDVKKQLQGEESQSGSGNGGRR